MNIEYEHVFNAPRQAVWNHLQSEEVLARTLPGCKKFEEVEEGVYHSELGMSVGPVRGNFTGKVRLTDLKEPDSYRLGMEGKGKPGEINADAKIKLIEEGEEKTKLVCQAEANATGLLASVGQRVMGGVAKMVLGQFFKAVEVDLKKNS